MSSKMIQKSQPHFVITETLRYVLNDRSDMWRDVT